MAALANQSLSLHATPLVVTGSGTPERSRSSYFTARTLTNEPDFSGQAQEWHVIGRSGLTARESENPNSDSAGVLPFATLLTVTDKHGSKVKISSPVVGWLPVADSRGYVLLAKGGSDAGVKWRYRVVCKDGAFVRHGIELTSPLLFNLPWHSIVEVLERRINDAGLPRLKIAEGWVSEVLNPLSGQRGPVVEIVRLLRPLRYRVTLSEGAVVRRRVELASNHVKTVASGEIVEVSAKQFSDLGYRCVQRLKLSDGSGWLSMRLNKEPPDDVSVVEFVGVSSPTSITPMPVRPKGPGSSSVKSREGVGKAGYGAGAGRASLTAASSTIALEDGESDDDDQGADLEKIKGSTLGEDDHCVVCLSGPRTSTIVHGEIGHIACCLECARILKARGDTCPVCRVPIDSVVQHFWA